MAKTDVKLQRNIPSLCALFCTAYCEVAVVKWYPIPNIKSLAKNPGAAETTENWVGKLFKTTSVVTVV